MRLPEPPTQNEDRPPLRLRALGLLGRNPKLGSEGIRGDAGACCIVAFVESPGTLRVKSGGRQRALASTAEGVVRQRAVALSEALRGGGGASRRKLTSPRLAPPLAAPLQRGRMGIGFLQQRRLDGIRVSALRRPRRWRSVAHRWGRWSVARLLGLPRSQTSQTGVATGPEGAASSDSLSPLRGGARVGKTPPWPLIRPSRAQVARASLLAISLGSLGGAAEGRPLPGLGLLGFSWPGAVGLEDPRLSIHNPVRLRTQMR